MEYTPKETTLKSNKDEEESDKEAIQAKKNQSTMKKGTTRRAKQTKYKNRTNWRNRVASNSLQQALHHGRLEKLKKEYFPW